ncbi:hypothetical protein ACLOJK_022863 [Asimina triloba]
MLPSPSISNAMTVVLTWVADADLVDYDGFAITICRNAPWCLLDSGPPIDAAESGCHACWSARKERQSCLLRFGSETYRPWWSSIVVVVADDKEEGSA